MCESEECGVSVCVGCKLDIKRVVRSTLQIDISGNRAVDVENRENKGKQDKAEIE